LSTKRIISIIVFVLLLVIILSSDQPDTTPTVVATTLPSSTPTQTKVTKTPQPTETPTPTSAPTVTSTITADVIEPVTSEYFVVAGDTLSRIAELYGVSVDSLAQANNITDMDSIYPGQVIAIPSHSEVSEPEEAPQKKVVVSLSQQMAYAYEGDLVVRNFVVSTGKPSTPTVIGKFAVYLKYESTTMSGPGYSTPDVPWTMYFFKGYALHGAYWHNNFGQPMSHGCVNLKPDEAMWLYYWAPIGTPVIVNP